MALSDEVQSRYPSQILVNLTNPQSTTAATVNTTTLDLAATDVQADFKIHAGIAYDGTDARHVSVACEGVIAKLLERTGHAKAGEREESYFRRLKALANVTGRDRILPTSGSPLTPSTPDPNVTHRPSFDDDIWGGIIPGPPA